MTQQEIRQLRVIFELNFSKTTGRTTLWNLARWVSWEGWWRPDDATTKNFLFAFIVGGKQLFAQTKTSLPRAYLPTFKLYNNILQFIPIVSSIVVQVYCTGPDLYL